MSMNLAAKILAGTALAGSVAYAMESRFGGPSPSAVSVVAGGAAVQPVATGQAAQSAPVSVTPGSAAGCQSRSADRPWGVLPQRTWTPADPFVVGTPAHAGFRDGGPFSARLIQAYGEDAGPAAQTAIFEMADGCVRQFRSASFIQGDVAYIANEIRQRPFPSDPATYLTAIDLEGQITQAHIDRGEAGAYQTQHFNFIFGTKTGNISYREVGRRGISWATFLRQAGEMMESGWRIQRNVLKAPMPYADASVKKKLNVYICGTGLAGFPQGDATDCGATGASAAYMGASSIYPGSNTAWHEFGHMIQFYTGGYRDRFEAGPIWETSANYIAFAASPNFNGGEDFYFSNLENGPFWSFSRYGAFPFMAYLFEQDATRRYVWSTWTGNLRTESGASTEDFVQTLVRQAAGDGVYPRGYQSFADDMGWYGARMVANDFRNQKTMADLRKSSRIAKFYTPLRTTGAATTFDSSMLRPLLQWGSHIVPLTPTGNSVSVRLTGRTAANAAAWRWMIVSVDARGNPRYSAMGNAAGTATGSTVSLPTVAGEKVYLAVTATPYAYESLGWQRAGKPTGTRYPYQVSINGARPLTATSLSCNSVVTQERGQNLNYNTNGFSDQSKPCS